MSGRLFVCGERNSIFEVSVCQNAFGVCALAGSAKYAKSATIARSDNRAELNRIGETNVLTVIFFIIFFPFATTIKNRRFYRTFFLKMYLWKFCRTYCFAIQFFRITQTILLNLFFSTVNYPSSANNCFGKMNFKTSSISNAPKKRKTYKEK